ncbi:ceramide synthase 4-like [Harpia harpyja]|uniref:ceramide synthase 4-like n=1 Tax=Harpia harpyja TaxID=202280 RepID=UPI0022B14C07|nr:ceramide synthase 4-like [Harpia harpyja]
MDPWPFPLNLDSRAVLAENGPCLGLRWVRCFMIFRMARSLNEWLWQHEFWLLPGITWQDMQESEDVHYPQPRDLLLGIPFALILVVIRCAFERAIALPLSRKQCEREAETKSSAQPHAGTLKR